MMITRAAIAAVLVLSLLTALAAAETQQAGTVYRIGWLWDSVAGPPPDAWLQAFRQGLRHHGWLEGKNIVMEYRTGERAASREAELERLTKLAEELVGNRVDLLVANPAGAAIAARRATKTIPIVFAGVSDPVGLGLVASLARPDGNATGLSYLGLELNPKRLELLREALPGVTRFGVLVASSHPLHKRMEREIQTAAQSLRVQLHVRSVGREPRDIDSAFEALVKARVGGVIGLQAPEFLRERQRIADLARNNRLPTIFELRGFAEAGALMAYAPSIEDIYHRAATYVDKIFKGAKPADLPVQQPTKFELVVNLKTAKALGLTIPPSLLLRADQVIE
jgi:putative tryptophan/tyrosine transport system substrate-binding protein